MDRMGEVEAIRPARAEEEAEVVALWHACGLVMSYNDPAEEFRLALGRPNSDVLVHVEAGRILGSVMVGHDGHRGWIYYLSADPGARGLGIGRKLLETGGAWLRRRGMRKAQLLVRSTNAGMMAFYEKLGYRTVPSALMQRWIDRD